MDSTCNKICYNSLRDANEVLNSIKKHRYIDGNRRNKLIGKKDKRPIRAYKCDICGYFHLTSKHNRK